MNTRKASLRQLLWLGWRKGYAMHDLWMWGLIQLLIALPVMALIISLAMPLQSTWAMFASPIFWAAEMASVSALCVHLHNLATKIGCTRQINMSEDGNPTPCLIDLGHDDCCKHVGPDRDKTSCPYWKPQLIID